MNRRRFLAAAATASTVAIAGCGADSGGSPDVNEEDVAVTVSILEESFDPQVDHVEEGEAVRWENERGSRVDITSTSQEGVANWDFRSQMSAGGTTAYLFENSGVYLYHDRHFTANEICGAVAVGDSTEEDIPQLPCNDEGPPPWLEETE